MFHKLRIEEISKETDEAVTLILRPENGSAEQFKWRSGQYLTFKFLLDGNEERRSYSICSAPHEGLLKIMAKKVAGGQVSVHINQNLHQGQEIESMIPMGNFVVTPEPNIRKKHLAFAAGSGITPILSIIKDILINEPLSEFKLYYGNRNYDSIIFRDELIELEQSYKARFAVIHYLSQEQVDKYNFFGGRLTTDQIQAILNNESADEYYICGPEGMISEARDILSTKKVDENKVHFEFFTTTTTEKSESIILGLDRAVVSVKLDGIETELEMDRQETVLNAAIDEGLDVPYACQGGTCCTCQAKLLEGEVVMDVNMVLTDSEIKKGYILTCQSHPTTPKIVIDYDDT